MWHINRGLQSVEKKRKSGFNEIAGSLFRLKQRAETVVILFLILTLFLLPKSASALSATNGADVRSALTNGAILVDVRPEGDYKNHIPGAINVPFFEMMDSTQRLYPPDELAAIIGDYGVDKEATTIVYGNRGSMQASYMGWLLEYLGAKDVHVYTGGTEDWQENGGVLSAEIVEAEPADFEAEIREEMRVDAEFLKQNAGSDKITIIDTRSDREFLGQDVRALRGGHIPGAINIDWISSINPQSGDLAPVTRLKQVYASVPKNKPVVVYCQTGARASMALLSLKVAGYDDVRLYPESWKDWGSNSSLPVENQTSYDFFSAQVKMNELVAENNKLLAELKKVSDTSSINTLFLLFGAVIVYAGFIVLLGRKDHSMTTATWMLIAVLTLFSGFLFGYVVSTMTGVHAPESGYGQAETGGYGK